MVLYLETIQRFQTNCVSTVITGLYSEDQPLEIVWQIGRGVAKKQRVKACEEILTFAIFCFELHASY